MTRRITQSEFEERHRYLSVGRFSLRAQQHRPFRTQYQVYLKIQSGKESDALELLATVPALELALLQVMTDQEFFNHNNHSPAEVRRLAPGSYIVLYQIPDTLFVSYFDVYLTLKALAPIIEPAAFVLSEPERGFKDEYVFDRGSLAFLRTLS